MIADFFHTRLRQTGYDARERRRRDAADVVVERRRARRVPFLQTLTVLVGEVLELDDDPVAEPELHRVDEFVHELVVRFPFHPPRLLTDVQRIVQQRFVVGPDVDAHRQDVRGVQTPHAGVQTRLGDGDADALDALLKKTTSV